MRNPSKLIGTILFISCAACNSKEAPEKAASTPPPAKQANVAPAPLPTTQTNTVSTPSPLKQADAARVKGSESKGGQKEKKEGESITYATHPERFVKAQPTTPVQFNISDPKTAEEHFSVGVEADNHKQLDKAIEEYKKALELKPDWAVVHFRLAMDYNKEGRTDDAIAHWAQAVRYDPQFYKAYDLLAAAYRRQGNLEKAIEAYSGLLKYPPAQLGAHYQMGFSYAELGDRQKAREHLESYRELALKGKEQESPRFQKALRELQELKQ
jgi:tetratricopeptide (TPR) repeat protein